jgi:glutaconate CoA-transferase subunit B
VSLQQRREANPFTEGSRELFDLAGQGRIDTFFLGGAQIDGEGAINLVRAEGKRFPGSFGSAYMYSVVPNTILFREEHSRRTLVPKVEFASARGAPKALLTGKALFRWQPESAVSASKACIQASPRTTSLVRLGFPSITIPKSPQRPHL